MEIFKLFGSIFVNTDAAEQSMQKAEAVAEKLGKKFMQVGDKVSSIGGTLTKTVTAGVSALGIASVKSASTFEDAMAKVSTIADESEMSMDEMRKAVLDLSNQTGISASDIAEDVYNAISAGQKTADAVNFVSNSTKLARAGFAETGQSLDVLTTIMNAYGMEAGEVARVSDVLIQTQNLGKTTVADLSSSMGKVIPTAKSYNVSLEQVASAYTITTAKGIATAESTTYINSMLNEMGKSGTSVSKILKEKTGKSFAELMAGGYSLGDCLEIVSRAAEEQGLAFNDMWGSAEAAKAGVTLLGDSAQTFNSRLDEMSSVTGAADKAFDKLETSSYRVQKAINEAKNVLIDLGGTILEMLLPYIEKAAEKVHEFAEWFKSLDDNTKETIVKIGLLAAAIGPLLSVLGKGISTVGTIISVGGKLFGGIGSIIKIGGVLSGGIGKVMGLVGGLVKGIGALIPAIAGVGAPVLAVIAVIGALVLAGVALYNNWEEVCAFAESCWEGLKDFFKGIGEAIKGIFQGIGDFIGGVFKGINDANETVKQGWQSVADFGRECWGGIKDFFSGVGEGIGNVFQGINDANEAVKQGWQSAADFGRECWGGLKDFFGGVGEGIGNVFRSMGETIGGVFHGIGEAAGKFKDNIVSKVGEMKDGAVRKVSEMGEKITSGFQSMKDGVAEKVQDLKERWGGKFTEAKEKIVSEVEQMKDGAVRKVSEMGEKITSGFQNLKDGAAEKISDLKEKWGSRFTEAKDMIVSEAGELGSKVVGFVTEMRDGAVERLSDVAQKGVAGFMNLRERGAEAVNSLKDTVGGCFQNMGSFIFSTFESFGSRISSLFSGVSNTVKGIVDKIKDFMSFDWKLPKIPLPHFSVDWDSSGVLGKLATKIGLPGLPKLDVEWYKNGGIMMEPTAFGINPSSGRMMAGGEAGPEAIAPIELLKGYVSDAVAERDGKLYDTLSAMLELLREYLPKYDRMQIVLDTGELVGRIAQPLNEDLGWIKHKRERGS